MMLRFPRNLVITIAVIIFSLLQGSLLFGKSNSAVHKEISKVSLKNINQQTRLGYYRVTRSSEVQINFNYRNKRCLHEDNYKFFACLFTTIKVYPPIQINLKLSKILQKYYYCNIILISPRAPPSL